MMMFLNVMAYTLLMATQTGVALDFPVGFEPPVAQYSSGIVSAPCMGGGLRIEWETRADVNHVSMLSFGKRSASKDELTYLNKNLSGLRGQIYADIACDHTASIVTFRDANPNSKEKVTFVQVLVTPKIIRKLEM